MYSSPLSLNAVFDITEVGLIKQFLETKANDKKTLL